MGSIPKTPDSYSNPQDRVASPKVLAISSGGGHWVQLLRLRPAFEGCRVCYSTVLPSYADDVEGCEFAVIPDANRWQPFRFAWMLVRILVVVLSRRPDVVVTTGAAPGYVAIRIARLFGSRGLWIDSIANVEHLSLSGKLAGKHADGWLTQWEHLAEPTGPCYRGAVLEENEQSS